MPLEAGAPSLGAADLFLGLPGSTLLTVAAGAVLGWSLSRALWLFLISREGTRYLFDE